MATAVHSKIVSNDSSVSKFLLYGLLFFQIASVTEAGRFKNFCKSLNCFSPKDVTSPARIAPPPALPPSALIQCPNPDAPTDKTGWNVYMGSRPPSRTGSRPGSSSGSMPTVEDIVRDIQLCGILDDTTSGVFYSFNGHYDNAQRFIAANPEINGKTLNQMLPDSWYKAVESIPGMGATKVKPVHPMAQMAWIARTSQALATAVKGKAYLIAKPPANIYTVPFHAKDKPEIAFRGPHNVWYDYEFKTLQNNPGVTGIYTVNSGSLDIDETPAGSWVRSRSPPGDAAGWHVNANTVTQQSLQKLKDDYEAQGQDECGEASGTQPEPSGSRPGSRPGSSSGPKSKRAPQGKTRPSARPSASGVKACPLKPKNSASVKPVRSQTGIKAAPTTFVTKAPLKPTATKKVTAPGNTKKPANPVNPVKPVKTKQPVRPVKPCPRGKKY